MQVQGEKVENFFKAGKVWKKLNIELLKLNIVNIEWVWIISSSDGTSGHIESKQKKIASVEYF